MQAEAGGFLFSISIQTSTVTHPVPFHGGFPGPFLGLKQLGFDVDFSLPI